MSTCDVFSGTGTNEVVWLVSWSSRECRAGSAAALPRRDLSPRLLAGRRASSWATTVDTLRVPRAFQHHLGIRARRLVATGKYRARGHPTASTVVLLLPVRGVAMIGTFFFYIAFLFTHNVLRGDYKESSTSVFFRGIG